MLPISGSLHFIIVPPAPRAAPARAPRRASAPSHSRARPRWQWPRAPATPPPHRSPARAAAAPAPSSPSSCRIGRTRARPAASVAARRVIPRPVRWLMKSTLMIASLTTMPTWKTHRLRRGNRGSTRRAWCVKKGGDPFTSRRRRPSSILDFLSSNGPHYPTASAASKAAPTSVCASSSRLCRWSSPRKLSA